MIIDGKGIAAKRLETLKNKVQASRLIPSLKIILVGEAAESQLYVRMKAKRAREIRIETKILELSETMRIEELVGIIRNFNDDRDVSGILVQLPLPKGLFADTREILEAIDPTKDVDCLTSANMGLLTIGKPRFYPATVKAVLVALEAGLPVIQKTAAAGNWTEKINKYLLGGLKAVVVGRSDIVGKPAAIVLANLGATVTVCNSRTRDLSFVTGHADILVSATGVPYLINKNMVKPGAIVIDVGINAKDGKVVGDVDPEVETVAGAVTPVPGGIGPLTISSLLENVFEAAKI